MRKAVVFGVGVLLFAAAGLGLAQDVPGQEAFETDQATFQAWDADGNGQLSREEFMRGARSEGLFNSWDANDDGRVDRNEFDEVGFGGDFARWDTNSSAYLDPREVYGGVFAALDQDGDGSWSLAEWQAFGERSWFSD